MTGSPILAEEWPAVKPLAQQFDVNTADGLVALDLPILAKDDSVLYRLSCRGGPEDVLDALGERDSMNWVAPFTCVLNVGTKVSDNSLLAEDSAAPWRSRGQYHEGELVGACGAYPEFGLDRSFRLRGFALRLVVQDPELDSEGVLKHFKLAISVESDPKAKSAQAEKPEYVEPVKGKCDVVRKVSK